MQVKQNLLGATAGYMDFKAGARYIGGSLKVKKEVFRRLQTR
jgi:hypothetical protein